MEFPFDLFNLNKDSAQEQLIKNMENETRNSNMLQMLYSYDFQLPIEYTEHKKLDKIVMQDLELEHSENTIMNHIFNNNNYKLLQPKYSSLYTTNLKFLKEQQKHIVNFDHCETKINDFIQNYLDYKSDPDFLNKYQYIQFEKFKNLNLYSPLLQVIGLYSFSSPLLALLAPIIGLILPYFVLLIKGVRISMNQYYYIIKSVIFNNYIINGILNFHKNSLQTNAYTIASIVFYFISIYNNITQCYNFYQNLTYLNSFIDNYNLLLCDGTKLINTMIKNCQNLSSFNPFLQKLQYHKNNIDTMKSNISTLTMFDSCMSKYGQLGILLKCNYEIFNNDSIHDTIMFLFYLNHYSEDIYSLKNTIQQSKLNACKFISTKTKTKRNNKVSSTTKFTQMTGLYYLPLINESNVVRNNISLDKNLIITGPNASGKTTILKSTLINLFLSQSIGFGCYDKCFIKPYDYFHSYLNIPDTSSRDSLFQAEARRCKDIIEMIDATKQSRHFCIFDEIYSGTNPNDAVLCASLYLNGINKKKNHVDFVLTTHYIDLCNKFINDDCVENNKMNVIEEDKTKFCYTYQLIKGISTINGGLKVLYDLDYPEYILNNDKNLK